MPRITIYRTREAAMADYGSECKPEEIVELADGGFAHCDNVVKCEGCGSYWSSKSDLNEDWHCCDCEIDAGYETDHRRSLSDDRI